MSGPQVENSSHFEDEVRRIARQLWSNAEHSGARIVDGRERDGIFETEDCVHLVEATTSRSKEKALTDGSKLATLAKSTQTRNAQKAVKCWFVTRDEPTADQRAVIDSYRGLIIATSFSQFQSKLIDVKTYLALRDSYPFGSIRDPATGATEARVEYVPLDLVETSNGKLWKISEIRDGLCTGHSFVALGDYGAGKSMTLREVYRELRKLYLNAKTPKFPIYLNLRDHFGQTNPAEVLERHARNIGFPMPSHLVRAWRAGYVLLLMDGFDELTSSGIQGIWKRLQDTRYRAMQAVREFIRNQPSGCGVAVAGRAHFFDTENERRRALGISSSFVEFTLNEFNDEQIQRYFEKRGLRGRVPSWLPSRPLLVGYLAASGILEETIGEPGASNSESRATDPATGWDFIINKICAREAEIEAGIDGGTVRRILERLATMARTSNGGLGPLRRDQMTLAFSEICGYEPDEKGAVLLQRLPGLGVDRTDEGTRMFLDEDLADICRAGDVSQFIADPFNMDASVFRGAECGLGALGTGLCVIKAQSTGQSNGKINAVIARAAATADQQMLLIDLTRIAMDLGYGIDAPLQIRGIYLPHIELNQTINDCSRLQFRECYFSSLSVDPEVKVTFLPRFYECYIEELDGRSSRSDLPQDVFDTACEFGRFSEAPETTNAIGGMELPLGARVLLSILRKIYLRSGSGRRENALHRGLDHHGRRVVPQILRLLQSEGLVLPYRRAGLDMTIWVPDRAQSTRVARIITSPRTCGDSIIELAARLGGGQ